ncbi:MAG: hypothetical protein KAY24_05755 [Candidatus Eisenbacteria sp.]|nr:hypothetical protein [Candidatus Eisenbacteria bacterium]
MMNGSDTPSWESARLIPVSGIRKAEEQERRATSAQMTRFAVHLPVSAVVGQYYTLNRILRSMMLEG